MLGRSRDQRERLDRLRARFGRTASPSAAESSSTEEAIGRLEAAVDRHFAKQAATRVTADRLVGALDVIPQGIVLADSSGQIVFRNRVASAYLAARHGDALVAPLIRELIETAASGSSASKTIELFGPPKRSLQLRSVPVGGKSDEEIVGAFLVIEDVSERQRLEAIRRDFVANISHELRTPVGALGLLAETLAQAEDPETARRLATRMQEEAFRVARTIDDLMALSQIEGSEIPDPEVVSVTSLIAEAIDRTGAASELREISFVIDEPVPSAKVSGDRLQLVSAIANLFDNAVKYSEPGSEVHVAIRVVPASLDAQGAGDVGLSGELERTAFPGSAVEIDISDEGIGIPTRDLERVFERFYRVDRARSRDTGGTGLGLAIVRHVVHNHEGAVSVASREGLGTTFTLRLPAA